VQSAGWTGAVTSGQQPFAPDRPAKPGHSAQRYRYCAAPRPAADVAASAAHCGLGLSRLTQSRAEPVGAGLGPSHRSTTSSLPLPAVAVTTLTSWNDRADSSARTGATPSPTRRTCSGGACAQLGVVYSLSGTLIVATQSGRREAAATTEVPRGQLCEPEPLRMLQFVSSGGILLALHPAVPPVLRAARSRRLRRLSQGAPPGGLQVPHAVPQAASALTPTRASTRGRRSRIESRATVAHRLEGDGRASTRVSLRSAAVQHQWTGTRHPGLPHPWQSGISSACSQPRL